MNFIELKPGTTLQEEEIPVFRSENKESKYIYFMAGVHGDEVEGVYTLKKLFEYMSENSDIEFPAIVIPILNVDGYRTQTRGNSHGVDLNRNCPTETWTEKYKKEKYNPGPTAASEPETKFLEKLFLKFPPKLIITFHSWKPMLNYNGECKELAEFINQYNSYVVTPTIGYPTPGSLGEWGPKTFEAPVLTYELPQLTSGKTLKEIWEENSEALINLLNSDFIN